MLNQSAILFPNIFSHAEIRRIAAFAYVDVACGCVFAFSL